MFHLINKKKIIKHKLKEHINEKKNFYNMINDYEDAEESINLINMNIEELTKLLKVIKIMIKNYNTIENIINFQDDFY